jgi:hypothetical protein
MFAHTGGTGVLPVPGWLLAYIGAAAMLGTAAALRSTWPAPRRAALDPAPPAPIAVHAGHVIGLLVYAGTVAIAIVGPDSSAANLAPWLVGVIWWVGLPIACLLFGDIVRHLNPFVPVVALLDRGRAGPERSMPTWTSAAFLAAWSWYLLAYFRPGSPRALATFMIVYALAAIAGSMVWGRRWLATGEAFGAISAAVARIGLRGWRSKPPVVGTAALMIVWIGSTAFDGFAGNVAFWGEVLGSSIGWTRTLLNTVGLIWITAIVAGGFLAVARVAERGQREEDRDRRLFAPLGVALVPLAVGWFLGHDLTLLLLDGQNAYILVSDPLGRGWDLFGTYDATIRYTITTQSWVAWLQVALIAVGHAATLVLLHELAMERLSPRAAMRTTWAAAVLASLSIIAALVLVLT